MTAYEHASINQNGRGLQVYLGVDLVTDSTFPLGANDDVYVHPVGDVGLLLLECSALDEYPITVPEPPEQMCSAPDVDPTVFSDGGYNE